MTFSDPKETTLTSVVNKEDDHKTLLDYLSRRFRYRDRAAWEAELGLGRLMVNGKPAHAGTKVRFKDAVAYTAPRIEPEVNRDIPTLWEDEHVLVVNKPAPLPVHSDGVFITNTLINILRERAGNSELGLGHRLDRETSGVMVLAKKRPLISKIMASFDASDVEKHYLAVVRGVADFKEKLVRGWMDKDPDSSLDLRQKVYASATPTGKDSATRFLLREALNGYSLLHCQPFTGRTNQIRVHLENIGLPLAGDKLYGRPDAFYIDFIKHVKAGGGQDYAGKVEHPRHLLHAWKLGIKHPVTGERMLWEAPMPADMEGFVQSHRT